MEKFYEFNYNDPEHNTRRGTMSFTSCHKVSDMRNLGCNYNVSLATNFLGHSDLSIGRLLLFKTKKKIKNFANKRQ